MQNWLIKKPLKAFTYALSGFRKAIATERAFQQEALVLIVLLIVLPTFTADFVLKAFIAFSWVMVMVVELLNSAIECAFDRFGTEHNALTKIGKDLAAAAVLLMLLYNLGLWIAVAVKLHS